MDGWIVLHRKITEWEWYKDCNTFRVFFHFLLCANIKPVKYMGFMVGRGSLITTVAEIAEKTYLSKRQVRTAINHLKMTNEVTTKTTNKFTVVTVVNYGFYQDKPDTKDIRNDTQAVTQATNERQTNDKQTTRLEEQEEQYNKETIKDKDILSGEPDCGSSKTDNSVYIEIIKYLNQRTGKNYKASSDKTKRLIDARIKQGFALADFYSVIDTKTKGWSGTNMEKYLRPETLFGTKFEGYLQEGTHGDNGDNGKESFLGGQASELWYGEEV